MLVRLHSCPTFPTNLTNQGLPFGSPFFFVLLTIGNNYGKIYGYETFEDYEKSLFEQGLKFLNDNNYEQAKIYSAKLINTVDSETNLFNSNNSIVDTLLMQKYLAAKTNGIIFQVNIDDLSDLPLSAEDLTVVLSNLIDNAIEAAIKCLHEKIIKIKIKKDSSGYILSVHNTTSRNISIENGEIIGAGKHEELLQVSKIYREVYEQQTSGGEGNA